MHRRRPARSYAFEIYSLQPDQREAAYADVPAEFVNRVRYYVEVYFPQLEVFQRNAEKARAERQARENRHARHP